ncbi:MAG: hypothetical protein ACRDRJ_10200 [Streptosporangiaceae bacterium]
MSVPPFCSAIARASVSEPQTTISPVSARRTPHSSFTSILVSMTEDRRRPEAVERTKVQREPEVCRGSGWLTALEVVPATVASVVTITAEGPKAVQNVKDAVERVLPKPQGKHATGPENGE